MLNKEKKPKLNDNENIKTLLEKDVMLMDLDERLKLQQISNGKQEEVKIPGNSTVKQSSSNNMIIRKSL